MNPQQYSTLTSSATSWESDTLGQSNAVVVGNDWGQPSPGKPHNCAPIAFAPLRRSGSP